MKFASRIFTSSVGKKWIVAITGLAIIGFLLGHLAGNLLIFLGAEHTNAYAHFLKSNIEILWGARIGLIVMFILHVYTAIKLHGENNAARPVEYDNPTPFGATFASQYMFVTGLTILVFVIYHLLHFTLQVQFINFTGTDFSVLHAELGHEEVHDVYTMVITGFSQPFVSLIYIVAMLLVATHVSHAATAVFQSIGIRTVVNKPLLDKISLGLAIFFFVGFSSIPVSILLGIVK